MLAAAGAGFVVDVRSVPRSRTNPQFNADSLPPALSGYSIGYRHVARLGGLRGRRKDRGPSPNTFWENTSFRNYADYAATDDFREGLAELRALGRTHACAIMCAEAVWWRCHRRIIADYLLWRGYEVFHILAADNIKPAEMNPAARPSADGLIYPAG